MTLKVNNLVGFGAAPAGGISTLVKQTDTANTADSITFPADINSGDLLVVFGYSAGLVGSPSVTTPSGWTLVGSYKTLDANKTTLAIWYKIADGSEASSTVSSWFSGDFAALISSLTFRADKAITSAAGFDYEAIYTNADPSAQTVNASGGTAPIIVVGYSGNGTLTLSPTEDGSVDSGFSAYRSWKIYLSSPSDTTVDTSDNGSGNTLQSCYFEVS